MAVTQSNPRIIIVTPEISDHQQSWGYEEGPWKGPGPHLCWWPLIYLNS